MGYYSEFDINFNHENSEIVERAFDDLVKLCDYPQLKEFWNHGELSVYDVKWYSADRDLIKVSEMYPKMEITMKRTGEEFPDSEIVVIKNGNIHRYKLKVEYVDDNGNVYKGVFNP